MEGLKCDRMPPDEVAVYNFLVLFLVCHGAVVTPLLLFCEQMAFLTL